MNNVHKIFVTAAPTSLIGFAEQRFLELHEERLLRGVPLLKKVLFVQGYFILFHLSDDLNKLLMWGGGELGHIMLSAPDGRVFVYNWRSDLLAEVGAYAYDEDSTIHPTFNTACHIGEALQLSFNGVWVQRDLNAAPTEEDPDPVQLRTVGLIHGYEVETLIEDVVPEAEPGAEPDREGLLPASAAIDIYLRDGNVAGPVSELPQRAVEYSWDLEYATNQGELTVFPGYPTTAVWDMMRSFEPWAFSPFTRNTFPYYTWYPQFTLTTSGSGFIPGWFYGDLYTNGNFQSRGFDNALRQFTPFTQVDATFGCYLDNRKAGAILPYGHCEVFTRGDEIQFRGLYGYLSPQPPTEPPNISFFYAGLTGGRTGGTDITAQHETFYVDLLPHFPGIAQEDDITVSLWNFHDRTDDELLDDEIESAFKVPRSIDTLGVVATNGRRAALFKVIAIYANYLIAEFDRYHSHSVSSDGTYVAVFESEEGGPIDNVRVFNLYHGFYGEIGRSELAVSKRLYKALAVDGNYYNYKCLSSGVTAAELTENYPLEGSIVDGDAIFEFSGDIVEVRNSAVVAGAESLTGCIIPVPRTNFTPNTLTFDLGAAKTEADGNENTVVKKTTLDFDSYTWRAPMGMLQYQWPMPVSFTWQKIFCEDGVHAKGRSVLDPCGSGSVTVLLPGPNPSALHTVTIGDEVYTGTFSELSGLLPHVLWSITNPDAYGFNEIALGKWKASTSLYTEALAYENEDDEVVGASPDLDEEEPVGTALFNVTITPGSVMHLGIFNPPDYCNSDVDGPNSGGGTDTEYPDEAGTGCTPFQVFGPPTAEGQFTVSGGKGPFTFTPAGDGSVAIDSDGNITSSAGCGSFGVNVTDSCGNTVSTWSSSEGEVDTARLGCGQWVVVYQACVGCPNDIPQFYCCSDCDHPHWTSCGELTGGSASSIRTYGGSRSRTQAQCVRCAGGYEECAPGVSPSGVTINCPPDYKPVLVGLVEEAWRPL
jgi:hypothetical protein